MPVPPENRAAAKISSAERNCGVGKVFSVDRRGYTPAEVCSGGLDACSDLADDVKVMTNLGQDQASIC